MLAMRESLRKTRSVYDSFSSSELPSNDGERKREYSRHCDKNNTDATLSIKQVLQKKTSATSSVAVGILHQASKQRQTVRVKEEMAAGQLQ